MHQLPSPHEIPKAPRVPAGVPALPPALAPSRSELESLQAAKWPPDDDGAAGGGAFDPSGVGGYGGGDDGNFKKGRFKPAAIVLGALLVLGGGAAVALGVKHESETMGKKEIAEAKKEVQLLPMAEALPKWRDWAGKDVAELQEEAFAQLAWAKDPQGLDLAVKGLTSVDHRVRGAAAQAIVEYGSPAADAAKPALLKALGEATEADKPQIAWALAVLKEPSAFEAILAEYRAGHLASVQRADKSPAFDPEVLASVVPLEKIAALASDESESVRQLVAITLSNTGDAKWSSQLIKLVDDKSTDVGREAAVGLGKIASEEAMGPLLNALARADKDSRQKFLEALRDGVGSKGLVLALRSVQKDKTDREKHQTKQIFDMIRFLEDPRGADQLVAYIASGPKPHWKTEAALRLAEIGDLRAVPTLGWRLRQDPVKLYDKATDPEYVVDDNERVVTSRMLADLAILYPEKRGEIRAQVGDGGMVWALDRPQPHANVLRYFAAVDDASALPKMRTWANPATPLPKEGQQEFSPDWATAQSALRYLGWTRDPGAWSVLERQLHRKPENVDTTMESLLQGGLAVMGMTLRGLAVGSAHGFAQWGDPKAFPTLTKYIEDKQNNEQARIEACFSLAWVATDDQLKQVVQKVRDVKGEDPKAQLVRACYLETLVRRPVPEATAQLVDFLKPETDLEVRHQAARAIGMGGVTAGIATQLFEKLKDPAIKNDAMLALLLGADADLVRRAMATYEENDPAVVEELKDIYNRTFGYWSDKNYENGDVARWIDNALACGRVKVRDGLQEWPRLILSRGLSGIDYDNGPHSITRVQLRVRLLRDARGGDDAKRTQAIRILKFMGERGSLMALKSEAGPASPLARQAYFELLNPKAVSEALPEPKAAPGGGGAGGVKVMP